MTQPASPSRRSQRRLDGALRPSLANVVYRKGDLIPGTRLVLYPEHCPVIVVSREGRRIRVRLPGGNEFNVPIDTLGIE